MDLTIDFACPECRKVQPVQLTTLALGANRVCSDCGAATELTGAALTDLERRLQLLFGDGETPPKSGPAPVQNP